MEWLEERGGATGQTAEEDYEEKLREVEEVCSPIIKQVGRRGWGRGAGWAYGAAQAWLLVNGEWIRE
jgi:heat shock protein 5